MYIKGLDGRGLTTVGSEIVMNENNRGWITDFPNDDDIWYGYPHDWQGGSLEYTVDVSGVGCGCAAGVFAVELDNALCSWSAKPSGSTPQCAYVNLMQANNLGFRVESNPCIGGNCDAASTCTNCDKTVDPTGNSYGLSANNTINT